MINSIERLTNQALLKQLGFPKNTIEGDSLSQVFTNLLNNERYERKVEALIELIARQQEERMFRGSSFKSSSDIYSHFRVRLAGLKQEHFISVYLDNKHQYIADQVITKGILNKSLIHPREVFAPAIELRAAAIICVHNHPSGDPQASPEDINMTKRLIETGKVVGISVLDHIIIGNDSYYSLADDGVL